MTPEAFAQACHALVERHEGHDLHRALDALVTDLLNGLGYGEGMAVFLAHAMPYHQGGQP